MPLSPSHISQIGIPVRDLDRAKRILWRIARPRPSVRRAAGPRLLPVRPDPADAGRERGDRRREGGAILYYAVDDARDAQAALAAAGAAFDEDAR